jgi:transposase, IS5 family
VLRETDPQITIWELLLPEEAKRLPAELVRVDAYLDDECFIAPWRALFDRRLGRPSVPVDTLLRLLYLKHRYGLGYESLCREVADSISWRRFCRIGLDRPVPHPTTLVKLVRRAGPEVIEQLNQALVVKLAADKLLRARKLRVDTTVVEADIDYPTDADLLEQAVRKVGGLVRRIKGRGAASRTRFRDRGRAAGRRMKQLARTLRRRSGVAMGEVDRLTGEVAAIARHTLREVQVVARNARRAWRHRPGDGRLGRLVGELAETIAATERLLAQTNQRLAGNRVIADRLVSLSDPDARPIRKGKPPAPDPVRLHLAGGRGRARLRRRSPTPQGQPARRSPTRARRPAGHRRDRPAARDGGRRPRLRHRRQRPGAGSVGRETGRAAAHRHPGKARLAVERTRAFRRLRNWRVGIEARISHLKRSFGLRRTRLRRLGGARTWAGLGIFAYNLQRMTVVAG